MGAAILWSCCCVAVEMNLREREATQKEREELMATMAENRRVDEERTTAQRHDETKYRTDLRAQIDYNRRQRALVADEQASFIVSSHTGRVAFAVMGKIRACGDAGFCGQHLEKNFRNRF